MQALAISVLESLPPLPATPFLPPPLSTLQGLFGAEKKRDPGNKFSGLQFFFLGWGEKGVENQAAWLRAFKQIKSCGKSIE